MSSVAPQPQDVLIWSLCPLVVLWSVVLLALLDGGGSLLALLARRPHVAALGLAGAAAAYLLLVAAPQEWFAWDVAAAARDLEEVGAGLWVKWVGEVVGRVTAVVDRPGRWAGRLVRNGGWAARMWRSGWGVAVMVRWTELGEMGGCLCTDRRKRRATCEQLECRIVTWPF